MEDNEGLKELLQSATLGRSPSVGSSTLKTEKGNPPLQASLLSSLLPGMSMDRERDVSPQAPSPSLLPSFVRPQHTLSSTSHISSGSMKGGASSIADVLRVTSPIGQAVAQPKLSRSLQQVSDDCVQVKSLSISQVKQASRRMAQTGNLISATRHCIAYVLGDRKIRLIAQENAATGMADLQSACTAPIVDLAWSHQETRDIGRGRLLSANPSDQLLASITSNGEVCVGIAYAESSSSLQFEPITMTTFPELAPAKGLAWNGSEKAMLAMYGDDAKVFIMSIGTAGAIHTSAMTAEMTEIQALRFFDRGSQLVVAGLDMYLIYQIDSPEEISLLHKVALPEDLQRIWLIEHPTVGVVVVGAMLDRILLMPVSGSVAEAITSIELPGSCESLFAIFDQFACTLCIGSLSSSRLICINLRDFASPILALGQWPNEKGSVSVYSATQLHGIAPQNPSRSVDMFLYAYHADSVKMHRLYVNWDATKSAEEPRQLPSPFQDILRPNRPSSASITPTASQLPQIPQASLSTTTTSPKRLTKSISPAPAKQITEQNRQFFQDYREYEISEPKRQHENSPSVQQITPMLESRIVSSLDACMSRMESTVAQKCEASLQKALGKSDKIATQLTASIDAKLQAAVDRSIKDAVESRLVPALQAIMTDLIGQLSSNISQAIVDSSVEQYKQLLQEMDQLRQSMMELQHTAFKIPSAQELADTVTREIRSSMSPLVGDVPYSTVSEEASVVPRLQAELEQLLTMEQAGKALIRVLQMGNLDVLNWFVGRVTPAETIDSDLITPPVQLSLAQQLGSDLSSRTEAKLKWLAELFTVFDPKFGGDLDLASSVLEELFGNLRVLFVETPASSPHQKQIKTVMRLVRMAMS